MQCLVSRFQSEDQGTLFMAFQASNRQQRGMLQLIKPHICHTLQPVIDQVGANLYSLVNRELLGLSSLTKAISQELSRQVSNPLHSNPESETLISRPLAHPADICSVHRPTNIGPVWWNHFSRDFFKHKWWLQSRCLSTQKQTMWMKI